MLNAVKSGLKGVIMLEEEALRGFETVFASWGRDLKRF